MQDEFHLISLEAKFLLLAPHNHQAVRRRNSIYLYSVHICFSALLCSSVAFFDAGKVVT